MARKRMEHCACMCICCDKTLDMEPGNNPIDIMPVYDGLIFRSTGNYGSLFDPLFKEFLQVVICDECIKSKTGRVTWIHNIISSSTANAEPFDINRRTDNK